MNTDTADLQGEAMIGRLIIIKADGLIEVRDLTAPPSIEDLQKAVGGYIELVPGWNDFAGAPGVMFCNENGKLDGLPLNRVATALMSDHFRANDFIVGDVVIITGDAELMEQL